MSSDILTALVERMQGRAETDDGSSEVVCTFQSVARWIPRAISPFMDLQGAMCAGLPGEDAIDENDQKNFDRIMKLHPHFPELILAFKEHPDAYNNFVAMMIEAFGNARAQDTNSARYEVPTFVPIDPLVDVVQPPITNNKSARGFNHPIVGKLLCPLRLLLEYEADPILFKNKVENATIRLRSHDERNWPSFLYPPETEYLDDELDKGLFRGPIVIRTLRMIYTGKGSAFTGYRSAAKPSQAEMHGMREVFPEAVAYAAVQAYYGLSSLDGWNTEDRFFKLDVFYDGCLRLFTDDPNDPWVIDTLQFLTKQMPALTRRRKRRFPADLASDDESNGVGNEVGILAQRARRREAQANLRLREMEEPHNQGDLNGENGDRRSTSPSSPSHNRSSPLHIPSSPTTPLRRTPTPFSDRPSSSSESARPNVQPITTGRSQPSQQQNNLASVASSHGSESRLAFGSKSQKQPVTKRRRNW